MHFKLVGWSHYGFTNDKGQYIEGFKLHVVRPSTARDFNGQEVAALSASEQLVQRCGELTVGGLYNVTYDQKGRLAGYKLAQAPGQQKIPNT